MQTSNETTNLVKAMIQAAPEIQSISKSKQAYGYKYATLDSLIDMLRGVLPKHGLWFMQMPTRIDGKSTLTTRIFHESGEWMEDCIEMTDTELQGKANDTQKIGASITYFRRYALSAIFGVASDEDVDGNLNSRPNIEQKQRQPSKPIQQAKPAESKTEPKPEQKEKLDPLEYLTNDWKARVDSGESRESIMKDYADLLKTDEQRIPTDIPANEQRILAIALFKRSKASA